MSREGELNFYLHYVGWLLILFITVAISFLGFLFGIGLANLLIDIMRDIGGLIK